MYVAETSAEVLGSSLEVAGATLAIIAGGFADIVSK
jgi:hypothetical protein